MFDAEAVLRNFGGHLTIALPVIDSLIKDVPERCAALATAIAAGDAPSAQREAHTLKGLAGNGGAPRLHSLSMTVEALCKVGDLSRAGDHLPELKSEIGQLVESWQGFLAMHR